MSSKREDFTTDRLHSDYKKDRKYITNVKNYNPNASLFLYYSEISELWEISKNYTIYIQSFITR